MSRVDVVDRRPRDPAGDGHLALGPDRPVVAGNHHGGRHVDPRPGSSTIRPSGMSATGIDTRPRNRSRGENMPVSSSLVAGARSHLD
jgi:hypothetical protein